MAVIVTVPADCPNATPALFTVAIVESEDDQVTDWVMPCLLPSLNVPVAVNGCPDPGAIRAELGVTAIDTRVALLTVAGVEPVAFAPA